jgi:hypothetical protein
MSPRRTTETIIRNALRICDVTSAKFRIFLTLLSEFATFLRCPRIQKPSENTDKIHDHTTTLHTIRTIKNIMYLFKIADPDFRAPHLLNTRVDNDER